MAALFFGIFPAQAEEPAKKPPAEYRLSLSPTELQMVGQALGQMPYRDVAALLGNIQKQMDAQMVAEPKPPPVPSK